MFSDPWPAVSFRGLLGPFALVAVTAEDRVAGYLFGRVAADEAEVLNLAVQTGHGRRGVATALVGTALQEMERVGATRVFLEVRESNARARAFYQKQGFRPVGRRAGYYSRPREDAVVLAYEFRGTNRRA